MPRSKGSEDLFQLIHSLTPEEKTYFKKFARRHTPEGNKLMSLFDDINLQEDFDEKALQKTYKFYAVLKQRLFDVLLKSLLISKMEPGKETEVMLQISYAQILQEKGLLNKALQVTEKALKTARKEEFYLLESILIYRHYDLKKYSIASAKLKPFMKQVLVDLNMALRKEQNRQKILREHIKIHLAYLSEIHADPSIAMAEEPVDAAFLEDKTVSLTNNIERRRLVALVSYYQINKEYEKAYYTATRYFELEKKLLAQKKNPQTFDGYINALRTLISICHITGRIKQVEELLKTAWKIPAKKRERENGKFPVLHL